MEYGEGHEMGQGLHAYVRVSKGDSTTEQQRRDVVAAVPRGLGRPDVIEDIGSGADDNRAGYVRLKHLIAAGRVKHLYVWSVDRLGRNAKEIRQFIDLCLEHDVALVTVKEKLDLSSPWRDVFVAIFATMAEVERAKVRDRIMSKFQLYRDEYGWRSHGSPPADGWLLPKVLAKVPAIWALHRAGTPLRQICRDLSLNMRSIKKVLSQPDDHRWIDKATWCRENPHWNVRPQDLGAPPSARSRLRDSLHGQDPAAGERRRE